MQKKLSSENLHNIPLHLKVDFDYVFWRDGVFNDFSLDVRRGDDFKTLSCAAHELCLQKFPFVYLLYESAVDSGYSTYVKHIVWHMTEKKSLITLI